MAHPPESTSQILQIPIRLSKTSEPAESAAHRVFMLPELLEQILDYFSGPELYKLRRICTCFHDTTSTSPRLRQKLFFEKKGAIKCLRGSTLGRRCVGRRSLWAEVVYNEMLLREPGLVWLRARLVREYRLLPRRVGELRMSAKFSIRTVRPVVTLRLDTEEKRKLAGEIADTPLAKMYLTRPPLPAELHICTENWDRETGLICEPLEIKVDVYPATLGELLSVAVIAARSWGKHGVWRNAQRTPCMWTRAAHQEALKDARDGRFVALMASRPHYSV